MQLIAICGKAGAGKDTVAKWFGTTHDAFLDTFAFPIKQTLIGMYPALITWKHFEDRELKETVIPEIGRSPRELAQLLGTEFGRRVHEDNWIRMLERRFRDYFPAGFSNPYVIHDMRFENEASWVRKHGGLVIHVERPGIAPVATHSSENGVAIHDEDVLIVNDGTIDDLRFKLTATFPKRAA